MEVPDHSGENGEQKEWMTFGLGHVPSHPPATDLDGLPPSLASEMVSVVFLVYPDFSKEQEHHYFIPVAPHQI